MDQDFSRWQADWAWSIPLILITMLIHAIGLLLIDVIIVKSLDNNLRRRRFRIRFPAIVCASVFFATLLHASEAIIWACSYYAIGAVSSAKEAMLYSLNAITSFGHAQIFLAPHWQLMGALEALNGLMLFGLTTAFLFSVLQSVKPAHGRHHD